MADIGVPVVTLLLTLAFSFLVVRVATVVLRLTGLSTDAARFQARSAFTGVGFTTTESELVVNHPVRRRVAMALMLLGSAGVVTVVAALLLAFLRAETGEEGLLRVGVLAAGLAVLGAVAGSRRVDRALSGAIEWALRRWTSLEVHDYAALLDLRGAYRVFELQVPEGHWAAGHTLAELALAQEGLRVLGIHRADGGYVGVPEGDTGVAAGDLLVLYGHAAAVRDLDARPAGAQGWEAHQRAVEAHRNELARQRAEEQGRGPGSGGTRPTPAGKPRPPARADRSGHP